ncbi:phospholipase A2 inhibitor and Ly6/PLAUR domain-containing protein [Lepus europaeus]|uniref:phospholipase A2 inhibitor and Ly6/PLAUR domain-containing protein n=1 Tax=Lepus europaeus TaxID=9983 RepID=UPI002B45DE7C|nr:phospholipase A2 inhibitor and Ly6/PLAUR domain-containing protein [Lepus europaeus]XP_062033293.1 phospholipase A2 inhibitor and Ly6/PLAUR domain-containing protein [Lepus europaeus]
MRPSTRPGHFLLALTLLCTLPGLGRPLTCEVCKGSGPTCSGRMKTCEAGKDACVVLVGESSTKGSQSVSTLKACIKFSDCYSGFVSTTMSRDDYMVSNAHCCQTDGCNQGSVPPPQNNRTENGRMCPSCIAPFQETCPGTRGVRCVGQETHCIYFAGNVQAGIFNTKFATRGCATESACHTKAGAEVPSASYLYFLRRADCLPAPWPPGRAE